MEYWFSKDKNSGIKFKSKEEFLRYLADEIDEAKDRNVKIFCLELYEYDT